MLQSAALLDFRNFNIDFAFILWHFGLKCYAPFKTFLNFYITRNKYIPRPFDEFSMNGLSDRAHVVLPKLIRHPVGECCVCFFN